MSEWLIKNRKGQSQDVEFHWTTSKEAKGLELQITISDDEGSKIGYVSSAIARKLFKQFQSEFVEA